MIAKARKHIGIYGGSFDPLHLGHLVIAQDCLEQTNLDEVVLVPAAASPLKSRSPIASNAHRIAMVKNAVGSFSNFSVSDTEIKRGGPSYSVDTVSAFSKLYPDASLYWILGQDQVDQLERWHCIEDLVRTVIFLAVSRPGFERVKSKIPGIQIQYIDSHAVDISSTEIRERFQHGLPNDLFLSPSVLAYIQSNRLYGFEPTSKS